LAAKSLRVLANEAAIRRALSAIFNVETELRRKLLVMGNPKARPLQRRDLRQSTTVSSVISESISRTILSGKD
jgi:hypothetical protein